jgi:hypothetical protein
MKTLRQSRQHGRDVVALKIGRTAGEVAERPAHRRKVELIITDRNGPEGPSRSSHSA